MKHLVLSHFVPAEDAEITEQMWLDEVREHYRGRITLGKELLEV